MSCVAETVSSPFASPSLLVQSLGTRPQRPRMAAGISFAATLCVALGVVLGVGEATGEPLAAGGTSLASDGGIGDVRTGCRSSLLLGCVAGCSGLFEQADKVSTAAKAIIGNAAFIDLSSLSRHPRQSGGPSPDVS
ncbi:hypothetical protein NOVOSPHI9U_40673 [Novosphingobium sp. 9U]|nr:hypothetical protein NOVOSPHI9U_40673 [Novosphingobium sp. 9U]